MKTLVSENGSVIRLMNADKKLVDSLLDANVGNRKLSEHRVRGLVDEYKSGRWSFNGATIVIGSDGVLRDGQHRLTALRDLGYPPVELIVVNLGSDRGVMSTIDTGKVRSCSDVFRLNGISNYARASSTVCSMIRFFSGKSLIASSISRSLAIDYYKKHKSIIDEFVEVSSEASVKYVFSCAAVSAAVAVAMAYPKHKDEIVETIRTVSEAEGLRKGTPQYALHRFLIMSRSGKYRAGSRMDDFISAVASGFIQTIENKDCQFLRSDKRIIPHLSDLINK